MQWGLKSEQGADPDPFTLTSEPNCCDTNPLYMISTLLFSLYKARMYGKEIDLS